jgi:hypothetical protein
VGQASLDLPSWRSLRSTVAHRTVDSGTSFRFVAEADSVPEALSKTQDKVEIKGLTTLNTDTSVQQVVPVLSQTLQVDRSVNVEPATLQLGTDSLVKRYQLNWSSTSGLGSEILTAFGNSSIQLPFQMLGLGDQNNVQNMPFQNLLLSQPDIEITVQLNGAPTQAGILCMYFVPLMTHAPQFANWTVLPHVMLSPNMNPTGTISIPYRYWRTLLDNQDAHYNNWVLGNFHLGVYSPLVTKTVPTDCGVTIFSKFVTKSRIPRTIATAADNTRPIYGFTRGSGVKAGFLYTSDTTYTAQGGNVSTMNTTNSYTIQDVVGNIPIESATSGSTSQSLDQKMDAQMQGIPLDNPPIVGGGIPTQPQFNSMSRSNGPVPTTGMYLHPGEMNRQPLMFRDAEETSISSLCARDGRIFNFSWSSTQPDGTDLYALQLNSFIFDDEPIGWATTQDLPMNIVLLNEFKFIHYDAVFTFMVAKTPFHSGRLMASVNYGSQDVVPTQKEALYNNILDFNGTSSVQEVRIPYNNTQEYIRAGSNEPDCTDSLRYGTLFLSVLNELRTSSEVVTNSVDVICIVRFENVRVAVPNPYSNAIMGGDESRVTFLAQAEQSAAKASTSASNPLESLLEPILAPVLTGLKFVGQADAYKEGSDGSAVEADIGETPRIIQVTSETPQAPTRICRVTLGEKFEYTVMDIHEVLRRYNFYPMDKIFRIQGVRGYDWSLSTPSAGPQYTVYRISVEPETYYNQLFAGWSGMTKFRIYSYSSQPALVTYVPHNKTRTGTSVDRSELMTVNRGTAPNPGGLGVMWAPQWPNYCAREMTMPVGSSSYIDVSIPFATELNFLPTNRSDFSNRPNFDRYGNGFIYVRVPLNVEIEVFWAAGDDFRYHVLCPSRAFRRKLGVLGAGGAFPTGATNEVNGVTNP